MAPESQAPVLSARSIDKRFNALVVLSQVNFTVGEGEAIGIVGPNGAGKTTLLNCVSGFVQPSAGSLTFDGVDVLALIFFPAGLAAIRDHLGALAARLTRAGRSADRGGAA